MNTPATAPETPLLRVEDLHVEFRMRGSTVQAVNGLGYTLAEGTVSVAEVIGDVPAAG